MIKKLIDAGYITNAQARSLELFIIGTGFSLLTGILSNVSNMLDGKSVDRKTFFIVFSTTAASAVVAGLNKYLRDQWKKEEESLSGNVN